MKSAIIKTKKETNLDRALNYTAILLLLALLFGIPRAFGQSKLEFRIDGLSPKVERAMQPEELIMQQKHKYMGTKNEVLFFVVTVQNQQGKSPNIRKIFNEQYFKNQSGNYDFSFIVDVPAGTTESSSKIDVTRNVLINIDARTTYGNYLRGQVVLTPEEMGKPLAEREKIYLSMLAGDWAGRKPANRKQEIMFVFPTRDEVTKSDVHIQIKNSGDTAWTYDTARDAFIFDGDPPPSASGIINPNKFDFRKNFIVRASRKTSSGYEYAGTEFRPWELGRPVIVNEKRSSKEFSGLVIIDRTYTKEGVWPPPWPAEGEVVVEEEPEEEPDDSQAETETDSNDSTAEEEEETDEKEADAEEDNTVVDVPAGNDKKMNKVIPFICDKNDTTLSVVNLHGQKVCIQNARLGQKGKSYGKLFGDRMLQMHGKEFTLKGGTNVEYHAAGSYITHVMVLASEEISQSGATFKIKDDSKVYFNRTGVLAAQLAEDGKMEINGVDYGCASGKGGNNYDLRFDPSGKVKDFTSTNEAAWDAKTELIIPAKSRFLFKGERLDIIQLGAESSVTINGKTFKVVPAKKGSFEFSSDGSLASFTIGDGHSTVIDGQTIPLQTNSVVQVKHDGTDYSISRVIVAAPVTVNVEKKGKVKEVLVKAGKKIVLENGVIIKAG